MDDQKEGTMTDFTGDRNDAEDVARFLEQVSGTEYLIHELNMGAPPAEILAEFQFAYEEGSR